MEVVVNVESGAVRGRREVGGATGRSVSVFRGIPFAAAPVGPLRFRAPQRVAPWAGTLGTDAFGPSPLQSRGNPFSGMIPGNQVGEVSEDCLTLNIWTPDCDGSRPVLVWIYGGAFLTGGTCIETYDGAALAADHDVVVVSANYRTGFLGFGWLGDREVQGAAQSNCGLRDQMAALEWVRANASSFGGDPDNVTAVGESAGAGSLLHLVTSPAARGLLRRCILQSPGVDHTLRPEDGNVVTDAVLRELGLAAGELGRLWELPSEAILDAQERALPGLMGIVSSMPFHPVVDSDFLPMTPSVAFQQGAAADVDLLVSWTADEMRLFPSPTANGIGAAGVVDWVRGYLSRRLGDDPGIERARDLLDFYDARLRGDGEGNWSDVWAAVQTDGVMRLPAQRIADLHAAAGGRTYAAQFSWAADPSESGWRRGAFHAIDLPFTFGTLDRCGWAAFLGVDAGARHLASAHMAAWAEFARHGRLAVVGLESVPYDGKRRPVLVFDDPCSVIDDPLGDITEAWTGLWSPESRAPVLQ